MKQWNEMKQWTLEVTVNNKAKNKIMNFFYDDKTKI